MIALKRAARQAALQRRARCDPAWGEALVAPLLESGLIVSGAVIAGFWPLPGEIDLRPLLHRLAELGHELALPVTPPRGMALSFCRWAPGEDLVPGRFGTCHPLGPVREPDLILVPLLAFDRAGRRLGYGGGYYDRTLAARPLAGCIGVGFAALEMQAVPAGPYDIRLPHIATERGVITCNTGDE